MVAKSPRHPPRLRGPAPNLRCWKGSGQSTGASQQPPEAARKSATSPGHRLPFSICLIYFHLPMPSLSYQSIRSSGISIYPGFPSASHSRVQSTPPLTMHNVNPYRPSDCGTRPISDLCNTLKNPTTDPWLGLGPRGSGEHQGSLTSTAVQLSRERRRKCTAKCVKMCEP